MKVNEVVVCSACRTAIGDYLGALKPLNAVDLAKVVAQGAMDRAGVKPEQVQEVVLGTVYKGGLGGNPARQVQLGLGMPAEGYASTVEQLCGSGQKAIENLAFQIMLGRTDIGIAIGTESMSNAPYYSYGLRAGARMGDSKMIDALTKDGLSCSVYMKHMGVTAENIATKHNISRQEQDELAVESHQKAVAAIQAGRFKEEIVPVVIKGKKGEVVFDTDEHPKLTTVEKLAKLRPAFVKEGTITAGNASGINDGAAAVLLMSADKAKELGIKPLAKILATGAAGVPAEVMGLGPAFAIPKVVKMAGLTIDDIGYFEINEAFAAQVLGVRRELDLDYANKVNANGSGIGLGHPIGCTACRIVVSAIYEGRRRGDKYVCASLCVGGGPAMATVLELL